MLYATTKKRIPQIIADVGLVVWVALWVWLSIQIHRLVMLLAEPAYSARDSAENVHSALGSASSSVGEVPVVGGLLSPAFDTLGLSVAGLLITIHQYIQMVEVAAVVVAVILGVLAVGLYIRKWLPWRWTFVRESTAGRKLLPANASVELFALRAMASAPMSELVKITPDPMGAWKRGDVAIIQRLANLELANDGLQLPSAKVRWRDRLRARAQARAAAESTKPSAQTAESTEPPPPSTLGPGVTYR